jgi:hypothetical protein
MRRRLGRRTPGYLWYEDCRAKNGLTNGFVGELNLGIVLISPGENAGRAFYN